VRDYGNRMGIPTVNGAVYFDDRYIGNPLVFCGCVGVMPRDKCFGNVRSPATASSPSADAPAATASTARPSPAPS
jgi:phosphoribosylformylglycinamidine (FGAM) synthase-like enzyme